MRFSFTLVILSTLSLWGCCQTCSTTTREWRILGGRARGRLETRASASDTWGQVCQTDFTDYDAQRACATLGMPNAAALSIFGYGGGSGTILADAVYCGGSASCLSDCTFSTVTSCTHAQDVGIDCSGCGSIREWRLVGGTNGTNGRLDTRYRNSSSAAWQTVCAEGFDEFDAIRACKSLGIVTGRVSVEYLGSTRASSTSASALDIGMSAVECSVDSVCLTDCSWSPRTALCNHSIDVWLDCNPPVSTPAPPVVAPPTPTPASNNTNASSISCSAGTTMEFRLVGTASRGRLEVRTSASSDWGTVCDDSFSDSDAVVACNSLGLPNPFAQALPRYGGGAASSLILIDDLYCSRTATCLHQCQWTSAHNCQHTEDVGVDCAATQVPTPAPPTPVPPTPAPSTTSNTVDGWAYRLAGGTATRGRLEVRPSGQSSWGTVCDDGFSNTAAIRACASLGIPTQSATAIQAFGGGTGTIYMDDVTCSSEHQFLHQCTYISSHNCGHGEDVGVDCSGGVTAPQTSSSPPAAPYTGPMRFQTTGEGSTRTSNGERGRLEVKMTPDAAWGTVCDDSFDDADALRACRSLGYVNGTVTATQIQAYGGGTGTILMDDVSCSSSAFYLSDCTWNTQHNCGHGEDVGVECWGSNTGLQVRLADNVTATRGRLEVRTSAAGEWGTVCDDSFDDSDALRACRSLGFTTSLAQAIPNWGSDYPASVPILMDDVECSSSHRTLADCVWNSEHNCMHAEDVGIDCAPATPAPPPQRTYEVRLAAGTGESLPSRGRVEVREQASAGLWGTVCDDRFSDFDAKIVCRDYFSAYARSLGVTNGSMPGTNVSIESYVRHAVAVPLWGGGTGPILVDELACSSTSASLADCQSSREVDCTHFEDVGVDCTPCVSAERAAAQPACNTPATTTTSSRAESINNLITATVLTILLALS